MEAERVASPAEYWPDAGAEDESWKGSRVSTATLNKVATPLPVEAEGTARAEAGSAYARRWKRAFDLALGVPLFVAAAPVIALAVTGVAMTTGWPAFYRTKRIGRNGREFTCGKSAHAQGRRELAPAT
jgi:lipopolysaccharide/colanic/teichoic acid biosynthesis glycosyltransferase